MTKSGSMTKQRFPKFCEHFVRHLPSGQGKGGEPVILAFDGHASRWSFDGLKYLLDNNVYCLCLPGHTSIWAQPNDGGPNASFKTVLGDTISEWRMYRRPMPKMESLAKMTRADFNLVFSKAWLTWSERMQQQKKECGTNCIITAWAGCGFQPYTREAPFWLAAIEKFGQRDELAQAPEKRVELGLPAARLGRVGGLALVDLFAAAKRAITMDPTPAPTVTNGEWDEDTFGMGCAEADEMEDRGSVQRCDESNMDVDGETETTPPANPPTACPPVTSPTAVSPLPASPAATPTSASLAPLTPTTTSPTATSPTTASPTTASSAAAAASPFPVAASPTTTVSAVPVAIALQNSIQRGGERLATRDSPANGRVQSIMAAAQQQAMHTARTRNFRSRLAAMEPGDCLKLQPLYREGEVKTASLVATMGSAYQLIHCNPATPQETLCLDDADLRLAPRFSLPAASKAELGVADAAALRARASRQAAAEREEAQRAAVEAATLDWWQEQAHLAAELGISFEDWQRIVKLLMKPPPKRVGGQVVLNSVAIGRAIVVDAAIESAIGEPLRQSVAFAMARAAEQDAAKGKPKEKGLNQDTWGGKDVTELIPELERQQTESAARAKALQEKRAAGASNAIIKRAEKISQACANLLSGKRNIVDLIELIKWRNGTPPANKKAENREQIERVWDELKVL